MKLSKLLVGVFCSLFMLTGTASAADWPEKPITVIVGYSAGGMADVSVRILADALQKELKQPLIIQNKGGAGGLIGLRLAKQAKPDGYTVYGGSITQPMGAAAFKDDEPLHIDEYEVVGGYFPHERGLYIKNDAPYKDWDEFIEYARSHPNELSIGFGGGLWSMYVMQRIIKEEDIKVKLVLYKSGGDASADFLGGHIDIAELGAGSSIYQMACAGKARAMVAFGESKLPGLEYAPLVIEKGYPYPVLSNYGFLMPKGTDPAIVAKFGDAMKVVLQNEDLKANLAKLGTNPGFIEPEKFIQSTKAAMKAVDVLKGE